MGSVSSPTAVRTSMRPPAWPLSHRPRAGGDHPCRPTPPAVEPHIRDDEGLRLTHRGQVFAIYAAGAIPPDDPEGKPSAPLPACWATANAILLDPIPRSYYTIHRTR